MSWARGGQRQVLFVTGETGIGKTTLLEACVQEVEAEGVGWIGWGQCIESYGPGTGYLPVLEALGRLCRGPAGETVLARLQQLIELQLGHLRAEEQDVLAMASVVGVEFAVASVAAGLQTALDRLEAVCEALAQRGQFLEAWGLAVWPDGTVSGQYRFRHAVYQQVLYRRLAAAQRVQGHRRIGTRLEVGYGARTAEIAAALAIHFERGRDYRRAVLYLQQAAENAAQRHASHEVITLLTKGLELLATLPVSAWHVQAELKCQATLGTALLATQGYTSPTVAQVYQRVQKLSQQVPDTPEVFQALWGLYQFHSVRGEHQQARMLAEQLLTLAHHTHDPVCLAVGYYAVGGRGTSRRVHRQL
jgi:predicted ATPase